MSRSPSPRTTGPVVHVLDASRGVPVAQTLLDKARGPGFAEDVKEDYAEMREEFMAGLEDRRYLTIGEARKQSLKVPLWRLQPVVAPACGTSGIA